MAIDTAAKRISAFSSFLLFTTFPTPDGTIGASDRTHLSGYYNGIDIIVAGQRLFIAGDTRTYLGVAGGVRGHLALAGDTRAHLGVVGGVRDQLAIAGGSRDYLNIEGEVS